MEENLLLRFEGDIIRYGILTLKNPYKFEINKGNQYAVIGRNGCGKSLLARIIRTKDTVIPNRAIMPNNKLKIGQVEFRDIYSVLPQNAESEGYYQQRYHATDNDEAPTVLELIKRNKNSEKWLELANKLNLHDMLDKKINFLSSGELRKYVLISALIDMPEVFIIDNPYIGLDEAARKSLNELLNQVKQEGKITIIMLLNDYNDIPDWITHIIPMGEREVLPIVKKEDASSIIKKIYDINQIKFPTLHLENKDTAPFNIACELNDCVIKYGKRTILNNVSWMVKRGERWSLSGPNGAGKSTLLSIICADNPQSYANKVTLFDYHRGNGESIWDIKKRIGFVSPEMHLFFNQQNPLIEVVASGFRDTVGMYIRANSEQKEKALQWLKYFGIEQYAEENFRTLSTGIQRLGLVARSMIKNPDLLILDEPMHGLDTLNKQLVLHLVEEFCKNPEKTLIYVSHYRNEIPPCVNQEKILCRNNQ